MDRSGLRAPPVVAQKVAGDAEEITARVEFAVERGGCAEKTDEALLHEIVCECGVTGDTGEIGPEWTGGPFVEGSEEVAGHRGASDGLDCRYCVSSGDGGEDVVPSHRLRPRSVRLGVGATGWRVFVTGALQSLLASRELRRGCAVRDAA